MMSMITKVFTKLSRKFVDDHESFHEDVEKMMMKIDESFGEVVDKMM